MPNSTLAPRDLRTARLAADLTVAELSRLSGVSARGIGDIERGASSRPRAATMEALRHALAARSERPDYTPFSLECSGSRDGIVGRDRQLAVISRALTRRGVVVAITGLPGVGKTALALEAIRRARPGAPIACVTPWARRDRIQVGELVRDILRQIDVPAVAGDPWSALAALDALPDHLRPTLFADGVSSTSALSELARLLPVDRIVATSRDHAAAPAGAVPVPIAPLDPESAERLLRSWLPSDRAHSSDVGRLAAACGGLPLAMRVAANVIASRPALSVSDFVVRMDRSRRGIGALVGGDVSVQEALQESVDLLTEDARTVLSDLSRDPASPEPIDIAARTRLPLGTVRDALGALSDLGFLTGAPSRDRGVTLEPIVRLLLASAAPAPSVQRVSGF